MILLQFYPGHHLVFSHRSMIRFLKYYSYFNNFFSFNKDFKSFKVKNRLQSSLQHEISVYSFQGS